MATPAMVLSLTVMAIGYLIVWARRRRRRRTLRRVTFLWKPLPRTTVLRMAVRSRGRMFTTHAGGFLAGSLATAGLSWLTVSPWTRIAVTVALAVAVGVLAAVHLTPTAPGADGYSPRIR